MTRSIRCTVKGCTDHGSCGCRWLEIDNPLDRLQPLSLESRLIKLIGWRASLGKQVLITIKVLEEK